MSGQRLAVAVMLFLTIVTYASSVSAQTERTPQVETKGEAALTRNFYFIFDGSGSMAESLNQQCQGDKQFATRLAGAKWAVEQFMPQVPSDVNLGLWVFDSQGNRERVPLAASNRERFLTAIQTTLAGGNTPLTESIEQGVNRLVQQRERQLGYGEFRLVVVTDGEATGRPLPRAVLYARERQIPIYTIGLCLGEQHELRKYSVSYRAANSMEALKAGLEETVAETPLFDVQTFTDK